MTADSVDRNPERFDAAEVVEDYRHADDLLPAERTLLEEPLRPGVRVLDLGVGTGRTTRALSEVASRYVGVDLAPRMVAVAAERFPAAELVVGDAADLSRFPDSSFDLVVFSYNGIDYLPDDGARHRCVREVRRVLDDGGTFVFSSHNAQAVLRRPRDSRRARDWAVAAYASARLLWRHLPTAAFWRRQGYVLDPVRGGLRTWCSTPSVVVAELTAAGYRHRRTVPGDAPRPPRRFLTPWWYYAFDAGRATARYTSASASADRSSVNRSS
jgi:SAM-dependent methyltransferase